MAIEHGEPLSDRELEITGLVAEGLTNREIAERLFLSHNTIKVHLRNIFTKTGVASRTELSMLAVQEGWIAVPGAPEGSAQAEPVNGAGATGNAIGGKGARTDTADRGPMVPTWAWQRRLILALGLCLVLFVLLLPQRRVVPAATSGPGDVFGSVGTAVNIPVPASEDGWQELAPLPVRRAGMGAVSLLNRIYAIGGMTDNGTTGRVDIYSTETDSWSAGQPRPADLANINAVALGARILVPGGCQDDENWTPSRDVHLYNPIQDSWSEVAPLPVPLCAYALAAYDNRAYLFGGWDGKAYQALAYVYDPEEDVWQELSAPEHTRGFGAAASLADRILYVGGFYSDREWATCEVYFPETDRWDSCRSMLQPRGGLSLAAIGGRVYAIGGGWHTPLGFNERYTPSTNEWSVVETPIVGEWRNLGAVPSETSVYATGGWGDTGFLNRTYAVEILPWRVFIPGTFRTP